MKLTALAVAILALGIVAGFALRATVSEASWGRRHSIHEQPAHARDETATITTFSLSPDTSALAQDSEVEPAAGSSPPQRRP